MRLNHYNNSVCLCCFESRLSEASESTAIQTSTHVRSLGTRAAPHTNRRLDFYVGLPTRGHLLGGQRIHVQSKANCYSRDAGLTFQDEWRLTTQVHAWLSKVKLFATENAFLSWQLTTGAV